MFRLAAALLCCLAVAAPARADVFPSRPVTLVVPFSAGAASDLFARLIAKELKDTLGQPIVIDNRPGANGGVAAESVKRAKPDGYTILMGTTGTASNVWLFRQQRVDPTKDFEPVTRLGSINWVIAVHSSSPHRTLASLVEAARAQPGQLSIGHGSAGGLIASHMLLKAFGIDMISVPYRSSPQATTDLIGGRLAAMASDFASGAGYFANGDMRPLAISGKQRSTLYPEVPSMHEAGVADFDLVGWFAAFVPAGTPKPIIDLLNARIVDAMAAPALRPQVDKLGIEIITGTPQALSEHLTREIAKWEVYVRDSGLQPE
ncbi:MAG: tripartite tricarboxylate transporter substrate binding protein [Alphaproteobacteria bacterium]|nr:tripartite tricarboxylate transporter substrate binding protein [Alphaproteobacteria bacterium]